MKIVRVLWLCRIRSDPGYSNKNPKGASWAFRYAGASGSDRSCQMLSFERFKCIGIKYDVSSDSAVGYFS